VLELATGARIIPFLVPPARGSEVVAEHKVLVAAEPTNFLARVRRFAYSPRSMCPSAGEIAVWTRAAGGGHSASSTF
jgi:hypothetical protein